MPITETIFVKEADSKSGTGKNGKPYTLWTLVDGTDRQFKTFQAGVGEPAKTFAGSYAEIDYEEKRNGAYTDFQLVAVRPSKEDQTVAPVQDNGDAPSAPVVMDRDRELDRLDCLKAAFSYGAFAFAKCEPDQRHLLETYCFGLASRMERWYGGVDLSAVDVDETIPF